MLLGEASHGTHEFYRERARITKRLIDEKGFNAVAVEADWPDAYRVNRYVLGRSADADAKAALADFRRFPAWMWRNRDVVRFVEWLRARNDAHAHHQTKARFYGLDLYSLRASMEAVVTYLDAVDPAQPPWREIVTAASTMSPEKGRVRPCRGARRHRALRGRGGRRARPLLERAIGVIYRPETRTGEPYFHALLPEQFDAPLCTSITRRRWSRSSAPPSGTRAPETYPTGF